MLGFGSRVILGLRGFFPPRSVGLDTLVERLLCLGGDERVALGYFGRVGIFAEHDGRLVLADNLRLDDGNEPAILDQNLVGELIGGTGRYRTQVSDRLMRWDPLSATSWRYAWLRGEDQGFRVWHRGGLLLKKDEARVRVRGRQLEVRDVSRVVFWGGSSPWPRHGVDLMMRSGEVVEVASKTKLLGSPPGSWEFEVESGWAEMLTLDIARAFDVRSKGVSEAARKGVADWPRW